MELQIDFTQSLPQHLAPNFDKVVSLLTQTVKEFPRGSALLTRGRKGVFEIKIWDKTRGEKLLGKKIDYYYEGDKSQKKVTVQIEQKPVSLRYKNPRYITITGFERLSAQGISNEQMDRVLSNFGEVIVPTQDVFADVFLTGKKKARYDLNKGMDIPRDLFVEVTDPETNRVIKASVRCFYKDQPYFCKRCTENHIGDCPQWVKEKVENEQILKSKRQQTKTTMIGDSNFRCINQRGIMANVTSISGGKIGHIVNQVGFEDLSNIENVVLSAGQNCLNDIEEVRKDTWESRTQQEVSALGSVIDSLMDKGKKVFIMDLPPTPAATSSKAKKEGRRTIQNKLSSLVQTKNKKKPGAVVFVADNDGNYNSSTDFADEKHLSALAIERLLSQLDEVIPGKPLKSTTLKQHATCKPYGGCYGTYPVGCFFCTQRNHNEQNCPKAKQGKEKRNRSTNGEDLGGNEKQVKT